MTSLLHDLGTVTVENGSPLITGEDTAWSTLIGALGGLLTIEAPGNPLIIKEVNGDGEIIAATNWTGLSGTYRYAIARASSDGLANARLWTMEQMGDLMRKPWGIPASPNGRGTLAQRDAIDPMPDDNYLWLRVEVDEPLELYFRVAGQWIGPYPFRGEPGADSTIPGPAGDGFNPAGAWSISKTYAKNDMVSHGPRSFVSFAGGNVGNEPPGSNGDDTYWQFVPAAVGPANVLTIGTVSVGPPNAEIVGDSPSQALNLTLPPGPKGPPGVIWRGDYDAATTYAANDGVQHQGSSWAAVWETTGNAPPSLPATGDANWQLLAAKGVDGLGSGDMQAATYDPNEKMADAFAMNNMVEDTNAKVMTAAERTKLARADTTIVGGAVAGVSQVPAPADGDRFAGVLSGGSSLFWSTWGNIKAALKTYYDTLYVPVARTLTAGSGLTGGGNLSANRTIALDGASIASLAKAEGAVQKANDTGLGGFTAASKNLGNLGSAVTISPSDGNIQHGANNAAVTITAPSTAGVYTIIVEITNSATAGAVALAGFTKTAGDAFTTTNGHKFQLHIAKTNSVVTATVMALQ